ncbi:MAG: galactosyldiacylglycerol synthase [Acidobacteria bacterium]|nr:galactosyldiacylglycerol synthase [Acidobacteriota bacterium]
MRERLDFIFFDAGGGHRAAATALKQVIESQARPWDVRLVNLQEVLDPLDVFRKLTGLRLQEIYNTLLRKGWTLGSPQLLRVMQQVIRLYHPAQVRLLAQSWRDRPPDLVVSLVPNFNRALFEGLRRAGSAAPFVTVLTDLADYPPRFWMEPQEQYFVCGTGRAVDQALAMGHARERVFRVSGMILRPDFYPAAEVDRAAERRRLGLDPDRPTGLVLFGGYGSRAMLDIARGMERCARPVQMIYICGKNERLAARLRARAGRVRAFVEGFTTRIPYYMRLADFLIGKPGPGSLSEALALHLPVIVERNAWTLPQERYNAEWIAQQGVGLVLPGFRHIGAAAGRMLEPAALAGFRAKAAALENRAVYEIPEILEKLLPPGTRQV